MCYASDIKHKTPGLLVGDECWVFTDTGAELLHWLHFTLNGRSLQGYKVPHCLCSFYRAGKFSISVPSILSKNNLLYVLTFCKERTSGNDCRNKLTMNVTSISSN